MIKIKDALRATCIGSHGEKYQTGRIWMEEKGHFGRLFSGDSARPKDSAIHQFASRKKRNTHPSSSYLLSSKDLDN